LEPKILFSFKSPFKPNLIEMDKLCYCLLLILLTQLSAIAQNSLRKSSQTSFYTYIYPVDDSQLESLYKGEKLRESILNNPVDSFLTSNKELPALRKGNYLKVYVEGN